MSDSGSRRTVFNTNERALSTDVNRLQAMAARSRSEMARRLLNDRLIGSNVFPGATQDWPSTLPAGVVPHDVIGGLMVRPDAAGYLLVDPGTVGYWAPGTAGADDSDYQIVQSTGVSDITALTFTANAGPGTRIDVVECRVVDVVTETGTRGVYDAGTGTFVPTTVDKVDEGQLEFRVALGTPGGGLRAPEADWIPLAIVFTLTTSAGFSTCDVYDVRPLVRERVPDNFRAPMVPTEIGVSGNRNGNAARMHHVELMGQDPDSSTAEQREYQAGYVLSEFGGYWAGGVIQKNVVTAGGNFGSGQTRGDGDDPYFWLADPENVTATAGAGAGGAKLLSVSAYFPGGYPRWVRYTQQSADTGLVDPVAEFTGRAPMGPRGILVTDAATNVGSDGITFINGPDLPSPFGLTGTVFGVSLFHVAQVTTNEVRASTGDESGVHYGCLDAGGSVSLPQSTLVEMVANFSDGSVSGGFTATAHFATGVSEGLPNCAAAGLCSGFVEVTKNAGTTTIFRTVMGSVASATNGLGTVAKGYAHPYTAVGSADNVEVTWSGVVIPKNRGPYGISGVSPQTLLRVQIGTDGLAALMTAVASGQNVIVGYVP